MTDKQKEQFNLMLDALKDIGKGYYTPDQLRKESKKDWGLSYQEALEMSYENIQHTANAVVKGIKKIK